jgi:hypothetical protein
MAQNEEKQQPNKQQSKKLSHKDAITADLGNSNNLKARELGYDGYVWEESKAQYTQQEVVNNDQTGPNKTVEEDFDPMEHNFIRADKLDESKK